MRERERGTFQEKRNLKSKLFTLKRCMQYLFGQEVQIQMGSRYTTHTETQKQTQNMQESIVLNMPRKSKYI